MKNLINLSGSIVKKEVLFPLKRNILENTFVCEATNPYGDYYGQLPQKAKPNSIFLFPKKFYFLEEILSFAQRIGNCLLDEINIATGIIEFQKKQYSTIRIKNFPDYSQLASLQSCLMDQGIIFSPKLAIQGEVQTRINKIFVLEELKPSIYMDLKEENKGYFMHDNKISPTEFQDIIASLRNNSACKLFDAVQAEILQDGNVREAVRVFAEGLDLKFLKCMAVEFRKRAALSNTQASSKYQHS